MIKISIDAALCRGHQMCVLGMPEVFHVGENEEGLAEVAVAELPDEHRDQLQRVAASCPQQAIMLEQSQK